MGEAAPQLRRVLKLFPLSLSATAYLWKRERGLDKFLVWIRKVIIIFFGL